MFCIVFVLSCLDPYPSGKSTELALPAASGVVVGGKDGYGRREAYNLPWEGNSLFKSFAFNVNDLNSLGKKN